MLAAVAVTFGAFGAHALKGRLDAEALGWWHTAVEYQMWHALAVVVLGFAGRPRWRLPAWLFVGGARVLAGVRLGFVAVLGTKFDLARRAARQGHARSDARPAVFVG